MLSQEITRTDIYENTLRITDLVSGYDYHKGVDLLPRPRGEDPAAILRRKAVAGLKKRDLYDTPGYKERLEEELDILQQMNFSTYFLVVANKVAWARSKGIFVGPGRGSGAGSLVNYALEITDVDPIRYGLLFFRFVNPERGDFPD
jgi:DNA polymerase-3 subunit alpha